MKTLRLFLLKTDKFVPKSLPVFLSLEPPSKDIATVMDSVLLLKLITREWTYAVNLRRLNSPAVVFHGSLNRDEMKSTQKSVSIVSSVATDFRSVVRGYSDFLRQPPFKNTLLLPTSFVPILKSTGNSCNCFKNSSHVFLSSAFACAPITWRSYFTVIRLRCCQYHTNWNDFCTDAPESSSIPYLCTQFSTT